MPGDISVMGVDDHEMAAMLDLTTVAQCVLEQGHVAARLLVDVLRGETGDGTLEPVILPTRLILRGSTAPLSATRKASRGAGCR